MSDLQNTKLRKLLRNARMVKDDNARIVQTLVAQVDRLTAERDAWRALVLDYNATHGYIDPIEIPTELEQSP